MMEIEGPGPVTRAMTGVISVDDVAALAEPVLQHRMALTFAARAEGVSVRDVIARLAADIA